MINNNWVFGRNAGLNFSTNPPNSVPGNAINTNEGCASISDANGNLIFYTDGLTVWDSNHTLRISGASSGLMGDSSSTQSAIIVPDPGNSNRYYVLTMDGSTNPATSNHFSGIRLDITTWTSVPITSLMTMPVTAGFSPAEKLTAVQHRNCRDFWVITVLQTGAQGTSSGQGTFRVFRIDLSGIAHVADTLMNRTIVEYGYLKVSRNGSRLAAANGPDLLLYPFDNSTGIINVAGLTTITIPSSVSGTAIPATERNIYGLEFSPNSNMLYYGNISTNPSLGLPGYIFQVDLTVAPLVSTFIVNVVNVGGNDAIGALQLGPDNRIYIAKDGEQSLGAILNPNVLGPGVTGCNPNLNFINLAPATCNLGLPNLLPNACEHSCNCGCAGCNDRAEEQNEELIERARGKFNVISSRSTCNPPFGENCENRAVNAQANMDPCFYFHWGDGANDQIEEHDTEVFYITVCNSFNDIQYNGLRITRINLVPNTHPIDKIQIVPDRFISLDCLEPCSCQTREFAFITRANDTAGNYRLELEYCFESITITSGGNRGTAEFAVVITED